MPGTQKTIDSAAGGIVCGTVGNGQTLPKMTCKRVILCAPTPDTAGGRTNTHDVLIGDGTNYTDRISPDGSRDGAIAVDNPAQLKLLFLDTSDKVDYRIEV